MSPFLYAHIMIYDVFLALLSMAVMVAIPIKIGVIVARRLRAWLGARVTRRRVLLVGVIALLLAAPPMLVPHLPILNLFDVWLVGVCLVGGLLTGFPEPVWSVEPRGVAISGVVLSMGLVVLELAMRAVTPHDQAVSAQTSVPILFAARELLMAGCAAVYPDERKEGWVMRYHPPDSEARPRRRVLHIGDSMLEGREVKEHSLFTTLLQQTRPGEEHLNFGVSSVGPDVYLGILNAWIGRLNPDLILIHVFPGNDLTDIDESRACCDAGPLLTDERKPKLRCPSPSWRFSAADVVSRARAPYPVRVLARDSELARRLVVAFDRAAIQTPQQNPSIERFENIAQAMVDLARQRQIPLRFLVMPLRSEVCGTPEEQHLAQKRRPLLVAALRRTGAPVDEAQPSFVAAEDKASLFQASLRDPHFSAAGHAFYAAYVSTVLDGQADQ